ncbi:hypothetical protein ACLOJK_024101, partial [Asimina triloba]
RHGDRMKTRSGGPRLAVVHLLVTRRFGIARCRWSRTMDLPNGVASPLPLLIMASC